MKFTICGLLLGIIIALITPSPFSKKACIQGIGYEVIMCYDGDLTAYFNGWLLDEEHIKMFQRDNNLKIDGIVGYKTTTKMNELNRLDVR